MRRSVQHSAATTFVRQLACVGLLAALLTGCEYNQYELMLEPRGEELYRELVCYRQAGDGKKRPLPAADLERLAKVYPQEIPASSETPKDEAQKEGDKVHRFAGTFREKTPPDVGGAGTFSYFSNEMGDSWAYIERFRGDDDLENRMEQRRAAAALCSKWMLGWLKLHFGKEPGFDRLEAFMRERFQRDLLNVSLYVWEAQTSARGRDEQANYSELAVRCAQYLMERDYFQPHELPRLLGAARQDDPATITRFIGSLVVRQLQLDDDAPRPKALELFRDPQRLTESWISYLSQTPEIKEFQEKSRKENPSAEEDRPRVEDAFHELVTRQLVEFSPLTVSDNLILKLQCPHRPFLTNGSWDDTTKLVSWEKRIQDGVSMPPVCHAFWSAPDVEFQTRHFGKIVLRGEELAQYIVWYNGLKQTQQIAWDNLLSELRPGGRLVTQIENFRFPGEKEDEESQAGVPRELILPKFQGERSTAAPDTCR